MRLFYLIPLFILSTAFAKPCGLQGSIEERIKDCAQIKGNFALVAITDKGIEFYKDIKSGLIWGNRITSDFNHYGSQKACSEDVSGYELLSSLKWRLPTIHEFEQAASHGMKVSLPNMNHWFWSSTPVKAPKKKYRRRRSAPAGVFLWDGLEEKTDVGDLKDGASVRCVAKE
jgi:hypothetical protein